MMHRLKILTDPTAAAFITDFHRILTGIRTVITCEMPFGHDFIDTSLDVRVALIRITIAVRLVVAKQWTIGFASTLLMNYRLVVVLTSSTTATTFMFIK